MEMTQTATISTTRANTGSGGLSVVPLTKSPEAESETPPRIQHTKPISFSNGLLKRHTHHLQGVTYKECLKNHAASLGGHALDGCGEFMPAPTANASDPTSLKCAACGCHRNFHRREPEESLAVSPVTTTHVIEYHPHHRHHPLPPPGLAQTAPLTAPAGAACRVRSPGSTSPPPISSSYYPGSAPHMLLALSSGAGETNHNNNSNTIHHQHHLMNSTSPHLPSRKRFRTKFSQEQKEKMHEFAEKVGWKMQKSNEDLVNGFCTEIGVERGVFKVWMHNNKNSKRSGTSSGGIHQGGGGDHTINNHINDINMMEEDEHGNGNGHSHSSSIDNNNNNNHSHHDHHQLQYNGKSNDSTAPTNGSSSSS